MLEHEADAAVADVALRGVLALEEDLALVGALQAGDDPQQAGLARARRAQQRGQLAAREHQAHVVHGHEVPEPLRDVRDFDAHASVSGIPLTRRLLCHSTRLLATSVTRARKASSEAAANAAWNWYSL